MEKPEFKPWPKIPRLNRDCIITEKLDGTNASILITHDRQMFIGSRSRWITPQNDNYGFAAWATQHKDELIVGLGEGHHFGEWWGAGIQRRYNQSEKKFSLFNVTRWKDKPLIACCSLVPVLYEGAFCQAAIYECLHRLSVQGSAAAPGFMDPEGIIIYHTAAQHCFKVTLKDDEEPKTKHGHIKP